MNPKQLANVLVKILGLSICVDIIPGFVYHLITGIAYLVNPSTDQFRHSITWMYALSETIGFVVGIFVIAKSEWVAGKLFPAENQNEPMPPGTP